MRCDEGTNCMNRIGMLRYLPFMSLGRTTCLKEG
jgi:hypothetical protein